MKVFNTLTEKKEEFRPLENKTVKMYVCGPTVYDHAHIGHARSIIVFDIIVRWLERKGYKVVVVRNYTDVDDKIIKRAKEKGKTWKEISETFIDSYEEDTQALNIREPNYKPKVSEHIPEIVELIKGLINKGYAYESDGDVYFYVEKFSEYGKLSKRNIEELIAGARVEPGDKKKNPLDFALWKKAKEGEPAWESPWGKGRPGWHIECSAMSMKYLGETMDIHGGGLDLIFPHHENEIAQSESYTGKPFVKYWLHNGFVMVNSEKMSKSLGNFFTIKDILKEFSPDVLRFFLISTHYRSPINFSFERLIESKTALERIKNFLSILDIVKTLDEKEEEKSDLNIGEYKEEFKTAMDDDFNTAKALGVIFELIKEINTLKDKSVKRGFITTEEKKEVESAVSFAEEILDTLGFTFHKESKSFHSVEDDLIKLLIEIRYDLKKEKNFKLADKIRDKLKKTGITLEDLPTGTIYKREK